MHILNNVPTFYRIGAGLRSISGNISMTALIVNACIDGAFILVLWILRKKTHLFDEVMRDDLAEWNSKHQKVR